MPRPNPVAVVIVVHGLAHELTACVAATLVLFSVQETMQERIDTTGQGKAWGSTTLTTVEVKVLFSLFRTHIHKDPECSLPVSK